MKADSSERLSVVSDSLVELSGEVDKILFLEQKAFEKLPLRQFGSAKWEAAELSIGNLTLLQSCLEDGLEVLRILLQGGDFS